MTKRVSEIKSVQLNKATFANHMVDLTVVNFFFGNNGTGKSTLARALHSNTGLSWHPERQVEDYSFHLYDLDFVERNLHTASNLAGVFTLDQQNIAVEKEIDQATKDLAEQRNLRNQANQKLEDKIQALNECTTKTIDKCWDVSAELRREFPATQEGKKRSKRAFFEAANETKNVVGHDLAEIKSLYTVAFDSQAKHYPLLTKLTDHVPDCDLVCKPIISTADGHYAQFVRHLGALGWIEQGHEAYAPHANGHCPYCAQPLPDYFEAQLAASVDQSYRENLETLKQFASQYRAVAASLQSSPRSHEIADLFPGLDLSDYDTQLDLLRLTLNNNVTAIEDKIQQPATVVQLEPVAAIIDTLNQIITNANDAIDKHNKVVNDQAKQRNICTRKVWERIAFDLAEILKTYRETKKQLEGEISNLKTDLATANTAINQLETAIQQLNQQTVNTAQTIKDINRVLRDSGFEGFSLQEKPGAPNIYEVIRSNGHIAERLSEGERNFIAFLYFYFQLHGSLTNTGETKDKIVIIDDPVSSMDNAALFIVVALVRELVNITLNNWEPTRDESRRDHIKQIFVLTHNAYFFKEATYNQVGNFPHVSYYLIQKRDNQSTIQLCERYRADAPAIKENYTPVTNAYAALWQEYKEVSSSTTLLNVMCRILEHYFIQLCGHGGTGLRSHILETNRNKFITTSPDGTPDLTALRQAESILAYLNHEMLGFGDDTFYIEHATNPETCRDVFHRIFTLMGQEQHYNMMVGSNASQEPQGCGE